ncbi:hypothetical protein HJC23_007406 [Cyclotella cryptica]|uniref:FAS1 domain-containing protein n=1 Tax=Cyclotella cryptica TaxID=29204 RepID=A0ABD3QJ06_9STRA|eukprot:CCRYP_005137-RA/>CCRYP_005137-RA protein AED:0.32 eAED:0.32 QI:0/-1/0/1/-1/1/1/0/258
MSIVRFIFLLSSMFITPDWPLFSLAFAPATKRPLLTTSRLSAPNRHSSHRLPTSHSKAPSPVIRHIHTLLFSNSASQAEEHIYNQYPIFYYLLQQNPTALQRIRNSSSGYAVFVLSDEAMNALGQDKLQLLEYACNDADLLPIVETMASFHVVSVPMTVDIMTKYNVVSTGVGELPVEVTQDGAIYVNEARLLRSYRFEDRLVQNYEDGDGNLLGSETMEEGGKVCLVHEVDGMVSPEELWNTLYNYYIEKNSGAGAM